MSSNISTSNNTDVGSLDRVVLPSSSFDLGLDNVTDVSSFRYVLNEESPNLDNPGLYNCKTCVKGFVHRSRKLFQANSDVTALGNHEKDLPQHDCADPVTNLQNCEGLHCQIPESSATSDTVEFISSPMQHLLDHNSNAELNEEQKQLSKNSCKKSECVHAQENQDIFICHVCGKVFGWKKNIIVHLRIHEPNIEARCPYKCNKCVKQFTSKQNLKLHMMRRHNRAKVQLYCNYCSEDFMSKYDLRIHFKFHITTDEAELPLKCDKCPKLFNQIQTLENHNILIHKTDVVPKLLLKCDKCPKNLTNSGNLKTHKLVHEKEYKLRNPYECDECRACFNCKDSLKRHMVNNHGAASKFICTQCKKYFMRNRDLQIHLKVHKFNE